VGYRAVYPTGKRDRIILTWPEAGERGGLARPLRAPPVGTRGRPLSLGNTPFPATDGCATHGKKIQTKDGAASEKKMKRSHRFDGLTGPQGRATRGEGGTHADAAELLDQRTQREATDCMHKRRRAIAINRTAKPQRTPGCVRAARTDGVQRPAPAVLSSQSQPARFGRARQPRGVVLRDPAPARGMAGGREMQIPCPHPRPDSEAVRHRTNGCWSPHMRNHQPLENRRRGAELIKP
jgi:hypothetical protein